MLKIQCHTQVKLNVEYLDYFFCYLDELVDVHCVCQVCEMDVSKQLQAYEVEYHVLQDELLDTPPSLNQHQRAAQLERTNQSLRQQNLDLLEELQVNTPASHDNSRADLCSFCPF